MQEVHREHAVEDITKSKTRDCHRYSFTLEGTQFHFIDTPGISDTGGLLQDSKNIEKVFSCIQNLPHINAVILVLNGAVSRTTINIENVLAKFKERLPDVVYRNMLVILTNCRSHTVNFHSHDLGLPPTCSEFHMQNSAFSSDPNTWSTQTKNHMIQEFKTSMSTINVIVETLCKIEPQPLTAFKDMDDDRNLIQRELHDARLMIMDLQNLQDELARFEASSNIHACNVEKFQNFSRSTSVTLMQRIRTPYYNTTCSVCNVVCHKNCGLNETPDVGHKSFSNCCAMVGGHCSECPGRCIARKHYHDRTVLRKVSAKIQEVVLDLDQRYRESQAGKAKAEMKCGDLQKMKQVIESELQSQYLKVKEIVQRLRETCRSFNVTAELFDFIACLKKEAQTLRSPSVVAKLQEFVTMIEGLCNEVGNTTTTQPMQDQISPTESSIAPSPLVWHNATEGHAANANDSDTRTVKRSKSMVQKQEISPVTTSSDKEQTVSDREVESEQKERRGIPAEIQTMKQAGSGESMYKSCTLAELIEASRNCNDKTIRRELRDRTLGKSIGLLSTAEQFALCEQFVIHHQKQWRELIRLREDLQDQIREETDDDVFHIGKVHPVKLLQLGAINLVIDHATKDSSA